MIEKILSALKTSGVTQYQIVETVQESAELFFIRHKLDMQREKDVKKAEVTIYREKIAGEHLLGSATVMVQESFREEQMVKLFTEAYYAAGFVKNKYYDLYKGTKEELVEVASSLNAHTLLENAQCFSNALFEEDTQEDVFINSAEVFAYRSTVHVMNSNGVDVSYRKCRASGEFVVQCLGKQDVETYRDFEYEDNNTEALKKKVRETLEMTRARAEAEVAPKAAEYRVILSGTYVKYILNYYINRSSADMIYPRFSTFEVGERIQGDYVEEDLVNVTLKATVPYSAEGIPMKDRELIHDGVLEVIHGNNRFSQYLGIEPTGAYSAFEAPAGTRSIKEMKSQPYLEIVNFSDFQMDVNTGHFGGEIRLGFLFDGEKTIPVTGGSINGSIFDVQGGMIFSSEMQIEHGFTGPAAVCLNHISVAGQ